MNLRRRLWSKRHYRVAIFGSARVQKDDKNYRNVYHLAHMLGEKQIDVITGGGPGIMEAGNAGHKKGANGNGSLSIGLGIKLPHEQGANHSVEVFKEFRKFSTRLDNFMLYSHAVVVAEGGVGTLLELFYTWQLMQVNHICHIPLILLGDMWGGLLEWLAKEPMMKEYFEKNDLDLLFHAKNAEQADEIISEAYNQFKLGNRDFCINYTKYSVKF